MHKLHKEVKMEQENTEYYTDEELQKDLEQIKEDKELLEKYAELIKKTKELKNN